jgi:hypothetical protein
MTANAAAGARSDPVPGSSGSSLNLSPPASPRTSLPAGRRYPAGGDDCSSWFGGGCPRPRQGRWRTSRHIEREVHALMAEGRSDANPHPANEGHADGRLTVPWATFLSSGSRCAHARQSLHSVAP